jgi:hypothetical protein
MKRLIIILSVVIALPIIGWNVLIHGPPLYYRWVAIPTIQREAQKLPGVTWRGIRNLNTTESPRYDILLSVHHKGVIALWEPTQASFSGGGPLAVVAIGDCVHTPILWVDQGTGSFNGFGFDTVADVVNNYDLIYQAVQAKGYCQPQDLRGAQPTE